MQQTNFKECADAMYASGMEGFAVFLNPKTRNTAMSVKIEEENLCFALYLFALRLGKAELAKQMATACLAAEANIIADADSKGIDKMWNDLNLN